LRERFIWHPKELPSAFSFGRKRREESLPGNRIQRDPNQSPFLRAIEEDAYQLIPAETYVRGFIRSYAKLLHLNVEEILDLYRHQAEPSPAGLEEQNTASDGPLRQIKNHFFDFLTTMAGGTPAYSLHKSILPPKD